MFFVRKVHGLSMYPSLRPGQIVVARRASKHLIIGDVVMLRHENLDKIKRITAIDIDKIYIEGDNKPQSTDSRQYGWIDKQTVLGKVIWPKYIPVRLKSRK